MSKSEPLFINGKQARKLLGFGERKFRRLAKAGVIPCWRDPDTNAVYYSRLALEAWALRNGEAA